MFGIALGAAHLGVHHHAYHNLVMHPPAAQGALNKEGGQHPTPSQVSLLVCCCCCSSNNSKSNDNSKKSNNSSSSICGSCINNVYSCSLHQLSLAQQPGYPLAEYSKCRVSSKVTHHLLSGTHVSIQHKLTC